MYFEGQAGWRVYYLVLFWAKRRAFIDLGIVLWISVGEDSGDWHYASIYIVTIPGTPTLVQASSRPSSLPQPLVTAPTTGNKAAWGTEGELAELKFLPCF